MTRLLQNTGFQIIGLAIAAIGLGAYVNSQNHRATLEKRMADLAEANQATQDAPSSALNSYQAEADEAREALNQAAERQAQESQARIAENDQVSSQSANFASTSGDETTSSSSQPAAAVNAPTAPSPSASPNSAASSGAATAGANTEPPRAIQIYFVEVPRQGLNELLSQSRQAGGDGVMNFGVVQDAQTKLAAIRGLRKVEVAGDYQIRLNQPSVAFKGMHDQQTNQNLGFTIQAVPVATEEGSVRFQIDVNRVLKDPNAGLESFNFMLPDSFTLPKRGAAVFTGALPHRPLFEGEAAAYRNSNILRVMSSPQFRQGLSDLAIVVEAK